MRSTVKRPTRNPAREPTGGLTAPQPILATIKAVEAAIIITVASISKATARIAIMRAEISKINARIAALDIAIPRVTAKLAALNASLPTKFASLNVGTPEPAVKLEAAETTTTDRKLSTSSSPVPSSASADFSAFAPHVHTLLSRLAHATYSQTAPSRAGVASSPLLHSRSIMRGITPSHAEHSLVGDVIVNLV